MKIICKDNYDREYVADRLIAENVHSYYGNFITEALNDKYSVEHSSDYYRLVEDDYVLWRGMEELVW